MFETGYDTIIKKLNGIDPVAYGKSRNFIDGAVTRLSPYISRGVISTRLILANVLARGYKPQQVEKLIQELAWRDYFQQVWKAKENLFIDLKQTQPGVLHYQVPVNIIEANTGIEAIDKAIRELYETGYMHNHVRMYVASVACNIARCHWLQPARWMYYHLLDADWASNACSWQWVSAAFSNKKYFANQDNINKYCYTKQQNSFLDIPYDAFEKIPVPETLQQTSALSMRANLPGKKSISVNTSLDTCIYNFYNLDPLWKKEEKLNRILLIEPSFFESYPVSDKSIEFMLALSQNIDGIQVYVGEFNELVAAYKLNKIYFKEHPTVLHYKGIEESRDWMFPEVKGYHQSFFAYWKKCERFLKNYTQLALFQHN